MKIRIIGPVGSGKTTLAHQLSKQFKIPVTSLDELNWVHDAKGDIHRTPEERQMRLDVVLARDSWIIEGVQYRDNQAVFADADMIYFKDITRVRNIYYLLKRYARNKFNGGPKHYANLWKFLQWENNFRRKERAEIVTLLAPYADKVKRVTK